MSAAPSAGGAAGRRGSGLVLGLRWRVAIYVSLVLWLAMAAGNIALFTVRPAQRWPVLEAVETCQMASLIPIALLLDRLHRGSAASRVITVVGMSRWPSQ